MRATAVALAAATPCLRRRAFSLGLVLMCATTDGAGAELDATVDETPCSLTVENAWPPDTPTVYVVGIPDRDSDPVRLTKGVTLNGVRLTETLLSGSVLILRPNGTGQWGYHAGFDIFREPDIRDGKRVDPRTLVEYDKWKYDPLERVSVVGGDMNLLRLFQKRPFPPASYEIAFPDTIRIRTLRVSMNCDQIRHPGVRVTARLYADRAKEELLAEHARGGDGGRFPVAFEQVERSRVFLEISAIGPQDKAVYAYWLFLEADLDTAALELPVLATGPNVLSVTDELDSSHRTRVVLRWFEKPETKRVWHDFEGTSAWQGCRLVSSAGNGGLPFTGEGFARARFPAVGRDHMLSRKFGEPVDLSAFNRLGIASRVRQAAPMVAIQFGVRNGEQRRYQYVRLRPGKQWSYQVLDIGRLARDKVNHFNIYFTAVKGYDHPETTCEYDFDTLCFFREEDEAVPPPPLPPHVASHVSPSVDAVPPEREIPPIQEWFPMGVYDGILGRPDQEVLYLLDQMKRLHMNTVYVSNGNLAGLERVLPLAEQRGIRLVYQGTSAGALYFLHYPASKQRLDVLNRQLLPRAREWVPRFRGRWGLLAWSLTEEITADMSRELAPYYDLVRELDPSHPPTVLHNNLDAAKADLETNRPLVVTHDFYPYFWSPRSGPSNPRRSISMFRARVSAYYRASREHGASLWMMPQAWGGGLDAPLDPPHYGYRTGMRTPEPGEIKQQGWLAIAEGATGVMFYATVPRSPDQHHLWDYRWTETANTRAAGELFAKAGRVAPLLCRLERDYGEKGVVRVTGGSVVAHSFSKRAAYGPGPVQYVVVASLDGFQPQTAQLRIEDSHAVHDMAKRERLTPDDAGMVEIHLGPGDGTVLSVGPGADYEADCALCDAGLSAR